MATRIGGGGGPFIPPAGVTTDNRLDQQREEQLKHARELLHAHSRDEAEHVVDTIVRKLQGATPSPGGLKIAPSPKDGTPASTSSPPASGRDLGRLLADLQREHGLPVTGKLDPATVSVLRQVGAVPASTSSATAQPTTGHADAPVLHADTGVARQTRSAVEQQVRARVDASRPDLQRPPSRTDRGQPRPVDKAAQGERPAEKALDRGAEKGVDKGADKGADKAAEKPLDRVLDPSRLLASLFAAGFRGKGSSLEEALQRFQASAGLPPSGKLDPATAEALAQHGLVDSEAPKKTTSDKPVEPKQQVRRALTETSARTVADREVHRDPVRPQAVQAQASSSSDVAARAAASALPADTAERARLDNALAQHAATERGVQEGTGDPAATRGHGEVEGVGAGEKGAGGLHGGGAQATGTGSAGPEGPEGTESAVGNAKAGDDAFGDDERGEANVEGDDDSGAGDDVAHWQVPPLSQQLALALETILRDDDGTGPVTYTWDVTFHRPGVYAAGQPAEELWHVAVHRATAFDPVWQTAADALASRMLYAEPDAQPPTIDDFILALRRARVR